jgi:hypothetical protein
MKDRPFLEIALLFLLVSAAVCECVGLCFPAPPSAVESAGQRAGGAGVYRGLSAGIQEKSID